MASISPRERLSRLVELASETSLDGRRELTNEIADLLLDWPAAYPPAMREPFEALLEKALADIEPEARALLADRFAERPAMSLSLLNTLIFDASIETRAVILARNASSSPRGESMALPDAEETRLLSAIRQAQLAEVTQILSVELRIPKGVAQQIVGDVTAGTLATLCKGAGISRAAFSALAILVRPFANDDERYRRLAAYDEVPGDAARALFSFWRGQAEPAQAATQAA